MTVAEMMKKWTREEFEGFKSRGHFSASTTYKDFIEMKRSQVELARQQKIELYGEDLDEVPYEEPPELTPEDEASLIEAWRYVAAQLATEKAAIPEVPTPIPQAA
jgi:hypothetical protein